jgi:glycerophosphoryl diester phosphodiesterase
MSGLVLARRSATHRKGIRTVDRLVEPWVMAHRGGGSANTQENAIESLRTTRATMSGMQVADGGDVKLSSDARMVCIHDDVVTRTTTAAAGTVAAMTLAQLQALSLRNYAAGAFASAPAAVATSARIPTFEDWLAVAKALNVVVTPEIKLAGNATLRTAMVQAIVNAGMTDRVIFQSFSLADLAEPKAAGIRTAFLDNQGPNANSNAAVAAAAPDYYSYDFTDTVEINDDRLTGLRILQPSLKYAPWTLERRFDLTNEVARLARLACHYSGIASHDPWWVGSVATRPAVLTADPYAYYGSRFASGQWITWPGHLAGIITADKHAFTQSGGAWRQTFTAVGTAAAYQSFNLQGWGCKSAAWSSIELDLWCDTLDVDATRWAGIAWNAPDDRPFDDSASAVEPNSRAYVCLMRQNGQMQIYRRTGNTSTLISPSVASTARTAGSRVRLRIENLSDGRIRMTRLDSNTSVTTSAADATYRGGYFWFGKATTGGGAAGAKGVWSFSDVALVA